MNNSNSFPLSISHRTLNKLLKKAPSGISHELLSLNNDSTEKENFQKLTNQWSSISKELLANLASRKKSIFEGKDSNEIMALGALEVHINMALHALKASEKDS